jgi:hypothetical protein
MFPAVLDAFVREVYEHQVRQGVDDLGRVVCGIVVLVPSVPSVSFRYVSSYLFAPLQGASDWIPVAGLSRWWVRNGRQPWGHLCGTAVSRRHRISIDTASDLRLQHSTRKILLRLSQTETLHRSPEAVGRCMNFKMRKRIAYNAQNYPQWSRAAMKRVFVLVDMTSASGETVSNPAWHVKIPGSCPSLRTSQAWNDDPSAAVVILQARQHFQGAGIVILQS